ncbi:hypothetical protein LTR37_003222 [Vermiconidia calcicola]|uniref:Uncharacterized protein n=1 Tax=Vermiconidia calcicola TaxID=1690605 RepID=A0ACC3NQZ2_9PEZI|nr:hypothetical protein LTR37_003222 [Vermiconidia calcicola]
MPLDVPFHGMNVTIDPAGFPTPGLPNHGWKVCISLVIMVIFSGLFVAVDSQARIWTRISTHTLGADDIAISLAMGSYIIHTTLWALEVREGYGADYLKLDEFHRRALNKMWFLGSIFWLFTLTMYKTTFILLLNRIFVPRGFQVACWCTVPVNSCWGLGNILGWIF